MTDEKYHQLLENYLDQCLSEEDAQALLDAFREDQDLKKRFLEDLQLSHSLFGLSLTGEPELTVADVTNSIKLGQNQPDLSESVIAELSRENKKVIPFPKPVIAAAIAALLLFGFFLVTNQSQPIATVAQVIDANSPVKVGAILKKGHLQFDSGIIRLDFAKGVRVTIEGPADFELISPDETRLHRGNITAHVPPAGIGFEVHTAKAEIIDLGTTFGVSVDNNGKTDVSVYEGEVEVNPVDGSGEIITEGNRVTVSESGDSLIPGKVMSRSFRGWPVLFGVVNTGGNIRFVNAQPIQNPSEVTDSENIVIFPEKFGINHELDVITGIMSPGKYGPDDFSKEVSLKSRADKKVNTYLIQYNPPHRKNIEYRDQKRFVGEVTFDRPIVAILTGREQLLATDETLGKKRFQYPNTQSRAPEDGDFITLSNDRKSIELDWKVMPKLPNGMDQIRVLVRAKNNNHDK